MTVDQHIQPFQQGHLPSTNILFPTKHTNWASLLHSQMERERERERETERESEGKDYDTLLLHYGIENIIRLTTSLLSLRRSNTGSRSQVVWRSKILAKSSSEMVGEPPAYLLKWRPKRNVKEQLKPTGIFFKVFNDEVY